MHLPKPFYKLPHFPKSATHLHEFILGTHLCYLVSELHRNKVHSSLNYINLPVYRAAIRKDHKSVDLLNEEHSGVLRASAQIISDNASQENAADEIFRYQLSREEQHMRILCAETESEIYVCFHGTENLADWMGNVNFQLEVDRKSFFPCRMHSGLLGLFYRTVPWIELARKAESTQKRLVLVGHSRGGALATMTGAACARLWGDSYNNFQVYSIAAPLCGDYNFTRMIEHLDASKFQNYFFRHDPVPFLLTSVPSYEPQGEMFMMEMEPHARDLQFTSVDKDAFFELGSEMVSFFRSRKGVKQQGGSLHAGKKNHIKHSTGAPEKTSIETHLEEEATGPIDWWNHSLSTMLSAILFRHHRMHHYYDSIQRALHLEALTPLVCQPKTMTSIIPKPEVKHTRCSWEEESGMRVHLEGKHTSGIMRAQLELKVQHLNPLHMSWSDPQHMLLDADAILPSSSNTAHMQILFPPLPPTTYISSSSARLMVSNIFFTDSVEIKLPVKNILIMGPQSSGKTCLMDSLKKHVNKYQLDDFEYFERPFIQDKFSMLVQTYAPQLVLMVLPSDKSLQYLDKERLKRKLELFDMVHVSTFLVFSRFTEQNADNVNLFLQQLGRDENASYTIEEENRNFLINLPYKSRGGIARDTLNVHQEARPIEHLHDEICAYFAFKQNYVHPRFSPDWDRYRVMLTNRVEEYAREYVGSVIPDIAHSIRNLFLSSQKKDEENVPKLGK